jgi:uncharacterized protein YndB with AHSA1/START domain
VIEPLELSFTVPCDPTHAFDTWTRRIGLWWPTSHSVSQDPHVEVTLEPRVGGRIYERTPGGDEHEWGEVRTWEPPTRLAYLWHLRQDRADATEVEITFAPASDGTAVRIVHRGWERLGDRGPDLRDRNDHGWAGLLPRFRDACGASDLTQA